MPYLAKFIFEEYGVSQCLISDVTWVTEGIQHGDGVVISLRDRNIPRRTFVSHIVALAEESGISYQLEVEGSGSSDGRELQLATYPFYWCIIGATVADADARQDGGVEADERVVADGHAAAEGGAGGDVGVFGDQAIVLDDGAAIDDGMRLDTRCR